MEPNITKIETSYLDNYGDKTTVNIHQVMYKMVLDNGEEHKLITPKIVPVSVGFEIFLNWFKKAILGPLNERKGDLYKSCMCVVCGRGPYITKTLADNCCKKQIGGC